METLFTWVHLSDVQLGHGGAGRRAEQEIVLERLRADMAGAAGRGCPAPDAILVTGDVAFTGAAPEYTAARDWLRKAGEAVGVEEVFVVPGNHDVDRGADLARVAPYS